MYVYMIVWNQTTSIRWFWSCIGQLITNIIEKYISNTTAHLTTYFSISIQIWRN